MNYNELNILENGFFNEFKVAQANLLANIAAGRGNTFAYTGAAGHGAAADPPGVLERREHASANDATSTRAPTGRTPPSCRRCTR